MKELVFKVEFLSDIVLPASSNTEGKVENLDFIPGSNFLGMVAREYGNFSKSFDVFHSGAVRFGDATILDDANATYKMPLSFFHEKLDDSKMLNHHLVEDFKAFKQLKQKRNGYITKDLKEISIDYNYAQKSAYDKETRKSKDASMYGYSSIPAGTLWQFVVSYVETLGADDLALIIKNLVGKRRLGKSKSSQYGLVEIEEIKKSDKAREVELHSSSDLTYLYAKSRIALVDKDGMATYDLKYLLEGLDEAQIVWDKCQIRTSTFTPYNGAMQTKCYERAVINSGSVMVLKDLSDEQKKLLGKGVGLYLAEGFGEILENPEFLLKEGLFGLDSTVDVETTTKEEVEDSMVIFLQRRASKKRKELDLAAEVTKFIKDNNNIYTTKMNAQWGSIRSLCAKHDDASIKGAVEEYISHGVAKTKWEGSRKSKLLEAIENSKAAQRFTQLLSMQMPKQKESRDD